MTARPLSVFACTPSPTESPSPSPSSATASGRVVGLIQQIKVEMEVRKQARANLTYADYLQQYNEVLESYNEQKMTFDELQRYILEYGIPDEDLQTYGNANIRSRVWKTLLRIPSTTPSSSSGSGGNDEVVFVSYEDYLLVAQESVTPAIENKIKDDGFRTFKGDDGFWTNVTEDLICRVLRATSREVGYVQGMNVLLGPFLRVMPELDSYYCFRELVVNQIPSYVTKNLDGVHKGIGLVKRCLVAVDPQLIHYILSKIPDLSIFSVRYVMTMMANVQPLEEVLKIWDAIFSMGVHMSLVIFCAYLISSRDAILGESSSYKIMKVIEGATLHSSLVVPLAVDLARMIPPDLLQEIELHCKQSGR